MRRGRKALKMLLSKEMLVLVVVGLKGLFLRSTTHFDC
jgi:hypothetical protein